ncbi:hypothetical protein HAX54_049604, partial [Datura stramonium]|nr:hypothetical protein [Datura stramonium]
SEEGGDAFEATSAGESDDEDSCSNKGSGKRVYDHGDESDEEDAIMRVCKSEKKDIQEAFRHCRDDMHMVGEIGASSSRALESVEHTRDHDPEGEFLILIGASGTIDIVTTVVVPTTPTATLDASV